MNATDSLLSPAQAAELAGCSVETIRDRYRDGSLRAMQSRARGRVKIPESAVWEWLGRPAARNVEPPLEDVDWSTPEADDDPTHDLVVCDEWTLYIPVHGSRLSEFHAAKARAGR